MATTRRLDLIATCTHGVEEVLVAELRALGAHTETPRRGAVPFSGTLETGYRAALWSRTASRVLLVLGQFQAWDADMFYECVRGIPWEDHLGSTATLAVDAVGQAPWLRNSHFAELRAKDAIVDRLRAATGERPSVQLDRPDIRVHIYLGPQGVIVSLDLAGDPLHRRNLDRTTGDAPLKENLAAAILMLAGWPAAAEEGRPLLDPMCGSGTFLIEAAWMARDTAPGLRRNHWGFLRWRGHDAPLWRRLLDEARAREAAGGARPVRITGFDTSNPMLASVERNAETAGLRGLLELQRAPLGAAAPSGETPGLLITNPPYGHRLGDETELGPLYAELGDVLRRRFLGWTAWVLTGSPGLAKQIGLRPERRIPLWNGPLECRLLCFPISATPVQTSAGPGWRASHG